MKCPKCEEELDCDEVDIGVGTMRGNYRCPACGWGESDIELPKIKEPLTQLASRRFEPYTAHKRKG